MINKFKFIKILSAALVFPADEFFISAVHFQCFIVIMTNGFVRLSQEDD